MELGSDREVDNVQLGKGTKVAYVLFAPES